MRDEASLHVRDLGGIDSFQSLQHTVSCKKRNGQICAQSGSAMHYATNRLLRQNQPEAANCAANLPLACAVKPQQRESKAVVRDGRRFALGNCEKRVQRGTAAQKTVNIVSGN